MCRSLGHMSPTSGHGPRDRGRRRRPALVPVASLLLLSPIGAELLAAYDDSTGRPAEVLLAVVFFAGLYGCPALLAREAVRRAGRGWPSILLLAAALAILEAGVIDQSFFAEESDLVRGWDESVRRTYIDPIGISAFNALSFTLGHVIHSFAAPIAVAEALRPNLAHRPWLTRRGITVALTCWGLAAALIVTDLDPTPVHGATVPEILGTLAAVMLLLGLTLCTPKIRLTRCDTAPASHRWAFAAGFAGATAVALPPDTWPGFALLTTTAVAGLAWLTWSARTRRWTMAAAAAAGFGALASRGLLAFLYEPLVGEVPLPAKLAHNAVMLLVVSTFGTIAVRRAATARSS